MKKFLKNIFSKLRQRFAEDQSVEMPVASLRVVEPFVTRARRYKPDELSRFLNEHYQFRFNLLTEMTEFRSVQIPTAEFALLDDHEMVTPHRFLHQYLLSQRPVDRSYRQLPFHLCGGGRHD